MKRNILLPFALGVALIASAQNEDIQGPPPERMAEIKAQKVAFITQRLQLTPAEAQVFWPIYNEYEAEMKAIRGSIGESRRQRPDMATLTDEQAAPMLAEEMEKRRKETETWTKYMGRLRDAVGAKKTLFLGRAERDFTREVFRHIRDERKYRRPGGPGRPE